MRKLLARLKIVRYNQLFVIACGLSRVKNLTSYGKPTSKAKYFKRLR